MTISVSEEEYFEALDSALDILSSRVLTSIEPIGEQALGALLAWAWDGMSLKPDTLAGLLCCDLELRDLALRIIVGRCYHGKPMAHPRADEIERFFNLCAREKAMGEAG